MEIAMEMETTSSNRGIQQTWCSAYFEKDVGLEISRGPLQPKLLWFYDFMEHLIAGGSGRNWKSVLCS